MYTDKRKIRDTLSMLRVNEVVSKELLPPTSAHSLLPPDVDHQIIKWSKMFMQHNHTSDHHDCHALVLVKCCGHTSRLKNHATRTKDQFPKT